METFFEEKQITLTTKSGVSLEIFMRPIKMKELQVVNRVTALARNDDEEFLTPMLLSLMIGTLSVDSEKIPSSATEGLMKTFVDFNFPDLEDPDDPNASKDDEKKEIKPLSFYIDFLVNQGHTFSDIMEMTMIQFNELVQAAADRLTPEDKKVLNPAEAFRRMGIPIRNRGKNNGN
jgi:hypothetical protein